MARSHLLPVLWTEGVLSGRISLNELVRLTSENAARHFGLYPRKGAIIAGADADLVIVDDATWHEIDDTFYHGKDTRFSIYMGRKVTGRPCLTMLRGKTILEDGKYVGSFADGKHVEARLGKFSVPEFSERSSGK